MNDPIPQSYKVEWLNTTLKFIKNDNQMIMKYPEKPIVQAEYFYNLISQHNDDVGLGFKSLYAPVWEAMKIFSLKYSFKVSFIQCKNGDMGHLVIEKILKEVNKENKEAIQKEEESRTKGNNKLNNDNKTKIITSPQKQKSETCENQKSNKTKSEKYFQQKRKIIESISPTYLLTTLQRILSFINDETEASLYFENLAPMEAKFLENFIGIYNRKSMFETLLSPACIDILDRMSSSFKVIDKTCKLEVGALKTKLNTKKRDVTFLKVPRYPKPTTTKSKLKRINNNNQPSTDKAEENLRRRFIKALGENINTNNINNVQQYETNDIPGTTSTDSENHIKNQQDFSEVYNEKNIIENSDCIIDNNKISKSVQLNNERISISINKSTMTEKNKNGSTQNKTDNKSEGTDSLAINNISIDKSKGGANEKKITEKISNLNINGTKSSDSLKATKGISNEFLKDPKSKKKSQSKQGIVFQKASSKDNTSNGLVNYGVVPKTMDRGFPRKNKTLQAMSVPVEIEKGLRMMRLMGWEGGALGLRGEGITEPIIPFINRAPGSGLGHVCERYERKQAKCDYRTDVLETILDLIDRNITVSVAPYQIDLSKKERSFVKNIVHCINERTKLSLGKGVESDLGKKILERMNSDLDLCIELEISRDNREITFTKSFKKMEHLPRKTKKKKSKIDKQKEEPIEHDVILIPSKKVEFQMIILQKIYELVKSEDSEITIDFNDVLEIKHREYIKKCCLKVNKRRIGHGKNIISQDYIAKIYQNIGENYLDIVFSTNLKSLVIRKTNNQDNLNLVKNKSKTKIPVDDYDEVMKQNNDSIVDKDDNESEINRSKNIEKVINANMLIRKMYNLNIIAKKNKIDEVFDNNDEEEK